MAEAIKEKEKKAIGEMLLILDSALFLRGQKVAITLDCVVEEEKKEKPISVAQD